MSGLRSSRNLSEAPTLVRAGNLECQGRFLALGVKPDPTVPHTWGLVHPSQFTIAIPQGGVVVAIYVRITFWLPKRAEPHPKSRLALFGLPTPLPPACNTCINSKRKLSPPPPNRFSLLSVLAYPPRKRWCHQWLQAFFSAFGQKLNLPKNPKIRFFTKKLDFRRQKLDFSNN